MLKIKAGQLFTDVYDGQKIIGIGQPEGTDISLISAKTNGVVTGKSLQLLQDITSKKADIVAKMNANYFVNTKGAEFGQALGVRCGLDEWSVPRQSAWYYYALLKDGTTHALMDTAFWYTPDECVFACSPAEILLLGGQTVNLISPSAKGSKDQPTTQSMLIRTKDLFAFAVCTGKLDPERCRQWAMTIDGIQDLCLMDSGGSSCLEADGKLLVETSRRISNALCFYFPKEAPAPDKKTMNGIDISNWQAGLNLEAINFDFVVCKATEGMSFVDRYCDGFIQTAIKMGKPFGFYHFARPTNDAVAEARFFVDHTLNYFGLGIPVLDWEAENKNDTEWALRWLNEVQRLTGVKPLIYMSESVVNAYDWSKVVAGDYGLWVAKYRDSQPDYNYDMSLAGTVPKVRWWSGYAMWQWTSVGRLDGYGGSLDCDIFYGGREAWKAYATSKPAETPPADDTLERLEALEKQVAELTARIATAIAILRGEEDEA